MRPLPFAALVLACFTALLGLRFLLDRVAPPAEAAVAPPSAEGAMVLPPKPEGAGDRPPPGDGDGDAALTEAVCRGMVETIQDNCWQALARQSAPADPEGALAVCAKVKDAELALECHADVAEGVATVDRSVSERICKAVPSVKWRGQCWFGIGLALAETDSGYALAQCTNAEAFRLFCRHDVVGEVALVDLEAAVAFCAREEGEELQRKTCWHGIGKYLARRDLSEAAAACARATPGWRGNCMHGAGWGAAERGVDAALAGCDAQAPFADNCRQGVAHQQKRADPERALALCQSIATPTIQKRCLDFVTR